MNANKCSLKMDFIGEKTELNYIYMESMLILEHLFIYLSFFMSCVWFNSWLASVIASSLACASVASPFLCLSRYSLIFWAFILFCFFFSCFSFISHLVFVHFKDHVEN